MLASLDSLRIGKAARPFRDFMWSTLDSWSHNRRVVGKAEVTGGDANPRFVVTSLKSTENAVQHLYEAVYCARGDMENRINEC
jgi:Transposase DDE domain group 1